MSTSHTQQLAGVVQQLVCTLDQIKAAGGHTLVIPVDPALSDLVSTARSALKAYQDREAQDPSTHEFRRAYRALVSFARWAITSSSFAGSDLCGGQVQEVAHKLGLLEEISVSEPCGESCGCAEVGDWPATCYRFAPALADPSHAEAPEAQPAVDAAEPPRSPAAAAIEFALEADEGFTFLRLWNEGCFDEIRAEWPEAPEAVFIGADPMHNKGEMK
jgi:hypothetical protein